MKRTEKVEVTETRDTVVEERCDLCGKTSNEWDSAFTPAVAGMLNVDACDEWIQEDEP